MRFAFAALLLLSLPVRAQEPPAWFASSFLGLREDVADAARHDKRLMLYFGQDGCPYCKQLLEVNLRQRPIVEKMRRRFVVLEINIWGDREVTSLDGRRMSEKQFAAAMKVQFTPTLLFFDEKGGVALRLNGYYPPNRFEAALDYVAERLERKTPFAQYMKTAVKEAPSGALHDEPFFALTRDLRRRPGGKPLALIFETRDCAACDEMHATGFKRPEVLEEAGKFDVVRLSASDTNEITAPGGAKTTPERLWKSLGIAYVPAIVFFDTRGREAFRIEAYVRAFHLAGASTTCRAAPTSGSRRSSASCRPAPSACAPAAAT